MDLLIEFAKSDSGSPASSVNWCKRSLTAALSSSSPFRLLSTGEPSVSPIIPEIRPWPLNLFGIFILKTAPQTDCAAIWTGCVLSFDDKLHFSRRAGSDLIGRKHHYRLPCLIDIKRCLVCDALKAAFLCLPELHTSLTLFFRYLRTDSVIRNLFIILSQDIL